MASKSRTHRAGSLSCCPGQVLKAASQPAITHQLPQPWQILISMARDLGGRCGVPRPPGTSPSRGDSQAAHFPSTNVYLGFVEKGETQSTLQSRRDLEALGMRSGFPQLALSWPRAYHGLLLGLRPGPAHVGTQVEGR